MSGESSLLSGWNWDPSSIKAKSEEPTRSAVALEIVSKAGCLAASIVDGAEVSSLYPTCPVGDCFAQISNETGQIILAETCVNTEI